MVWNSQHQRCINKIQTWYRHCLCPFLNLLPGAIRCHTETMLIVFSWAGLPSCSTASPQCKTTRHTADIEFHVTTRADKTILGGEACTELELVRMVETLTPSIKKEVIEKNAVVFTGLGEFPGVHHHQLYTRGLICSPCDSWLLEHISFDHVLIVTHSKISGEERGDKTCQQTNFFLELSQPAKCSNKMTVGPLVTSQGGIPESRFCLSLNWINLLWLGKLWVKHGCSSEAERESVGENCYRVNARFDWTIQLT